MPDKRTQDTLYIFNLSLDISDSALKHGYDWAIELSNYFEYTTVVSTRVGTRLTLPKNTQLIELGGGTFFRRLRAGAKLIVLLLRIWKVRSRSTVFYHMSHKPLLLLGPFLKLGGINQVLWYSHSQRSLSLRIASLWARTIVSPTKNTFPYRFKKVIPVGHGIKNVELPIEVFKNRKFNGKILIVGRVNKVKFIEDVLLGLSQTKYSLSIALAGRIEDNDYLSQLKEQCLFQNVGLSVLGDLESSELVHQLCDYSLGFSGTKGSVDKAPLEMNQFGIFVITLNPSLLEISGQREIVSALFNHDLTQMNIQQQFKWWCDLSLSDKEILAEELSIFSKRNNTIKAVVKRIVELL